MIKFDFTEGEWEISKAVNKAIVQKSNPELNLLGLDNAGYAIVMRPGDARLISCTPEMLKMLISYQQTYDVLMEIFKDREIKNVVRGAFIGTHGSIKLIEKATGKTWEQIND